MWGERTHPFLAEGPDDQPSLRSPPLRGPSPLQSVCRSHRQTGSDSEGPRGGRGKASWYGASSRPPVWSTLCLLGPEARSPAATSCLHLWHLPAELGSRPASRQDRTGSQLREALLQAQSGSRVPSGESGLLGRPGSECFRKQEEHATAALKAALGVSWCLGPPAHRGGADAVSMGGLWALQAEA